MSRVPLHLDPHPLETQENEFFVVSEEWATDCRSPYPRLGTLVFDPVSKSCTFNPEPLWIAEGYFPENRLSFTKESLADFLRNPASYSPSSIYSYRLLRAIESVFALRCSTAQQIPGGQNAG